MKKILILFLSFAALVSAKDTLTGRQIMQKMKDANTTSLGIFIKGKLEIQNLKTGYKDERSYISLTAKQNGLTKSLFRFTDSSYRGTTFLAIEKKKGPNIQYLYLPSIGSPRQVSASDKENNFLDTDIANEDLGGVSIDDYTYKHLSDRTVNGKDCYVVERYPKNKHSKYSKHLMIIEKDILLPIAAKSYGKDGRVVKIMKGFGVLTLSKNLHILKRMVITDLSRQHRTIVNITLAKEKKNNLGYFNKNRMNLTWKEELYN